MDRRMPISLITVLCLGIAFLYVPILVLIGYSFNASALGSVWGGFSTHWYSALLEDAQIRKAAVLSLTQFLAREWAKTGVRVNSITPGFFPAEQNRKLLDHERIGNIMHHTPMRRFGEPDELIGALLLLVSPKAGSFMTGAAINVDGGFTAAWF